MLASFFCWEEALSAQAAEVELGGVGALSAQAKLVGEFGVPPKDFEEVTGLSRLGSGHLPKWVLESFNSGDVSPGAIAA